MAIMATESGTSSKKPGAHEPHDERDAKSARAGESGKGSGDKGEQKASSPEPEPVDDELDDPYDNVACTD
jgi:hypothetical protein